MDYKEAIEYIESRGNFSAAPGLERIRELTDALGKPQQGMKFIHVAGTNGKGSCAAMTASVLKAAGLKTGLYTSPYLFRINERMQINGRQIEDDTLTQIMTEIKPAAEKMEVAPTQFELLTAAGLVWFAREACDAVVLETGLGGRFDATNVIEAPLCSAIMNIGLDHTKILGDTLEKIAAEKAGIIKPGCDCVLYGQTPGVERVIREECERKNSPLHVADFGALESVFDSTDGQVFSYRGETYALPLLGEHQLKNAAVVLEICSVLREKGFRLDKDTVEHGLYSVSWPGRFEIVADDPFFVVDGGHNPQCAETVRENLKKYFPDTRRIILAGALADKDYEKLYEIIAPEADGFVCITPPCARALKAEALAEHLAKYGKPVSACDTIAEGVETAKEAAGEDGMVCAVGSLYSVGEIRACFGLH